MSWLKNKLHPLQYKQKVIINGKPFQVEWTERAEKGLDARAIPLNIEMKLFFSCMVRKIINFHETYDEPIKPESLHPVTNKISVWFHPVISSVCEIGEKQYQHNTVDVNLSNLKKYFPNRLRVDFNKGQWEGHYS